MQCLSNARQRRTGLRAVVASIAIALALPFAAGVALAQTGTIVGVITDQATKTPVPSVQVQIIGSSRAVLSGADGHYRFAAVPSGPTQIRATRIGYAAVARTVSVPTGDVATVDFVLAATQVTLDQVVVTGTQATQRERESGNLVAVIAADSINKGAISTFSDLIAAKAAGVDVTQSSGEVGTASRIRIRGSNSISLTNDPLLVIDGVFVDNGSNSLATAIFTGGQTVSRFDDINPDEIENVEILKGPSASALYGTAGANGVILVTTKKGAAGRAVWTAHGDYGGVFQGAIYPANFGEVGIINGGPNNGARFTGCTLIFQVEGVCTPKDSLIQWNPLMSSLYSPFTKGNARYLFGGSVAGGSDVTKYFVSGDFNNEHGLQANSYQSRNNGRANIQATPTSKTDFSINAGYFQSRLQLPQNDNNEASALATGTLGQPVNDANHGYFFLINPAQSASIVTSQNVERFTGGTTGNWRPLGWLTLTGSGGLDVTNRNDFQFIPIGAEAAFSANAGTGFAQSNPAQISDYTAQFTATAQYPVGASIHGTTTAGTQYTNNVLRETGASGFGLVSGTSSVAGATNQFAVSQIGNNQIVDVGYFAQQQFGWRDKVFLTAALRLDDNSSFGQAYVPSFYPSISGSWVIGEEPWFPRGAVLSSLRLRAAYGFSGQHPGFQQASTFYNTITAFVPGSGELPAVTL
jgi:TonB-dependent starch-binding outer membrane protein SusC